MKNKKYKRGLSEVGNELEHEEIRGCELSLLMGKSWRHMLLQIIFLLPFCVFKLILQFEIG